MGKQPALAANHGAVQAVIGGNPVKRIQQCGPKRRGQQVCGRVVEGNNGYIAPAVDLNRPG